MSGRCLLLQAGPAKGKSVWSDASLETRVESVDQYAIRDVPLAQYPGLIVTMHADQRWFASLGNLIEDYLSASGAIAFNGHILYPFLPELRPFVPMESPRLQDLGVVRSENHPVFAGLDPASMNCRRGVAGFWGRGHNPPPEGAIVLQTLGHGRVPVDWVYHRPGGGRLLVHSGNDPWTNFESGEDNVRIARQLVDWLCDVSDAARDTI